MKPSLLLFLLWVSFCVLPDALSFTAAAEPEGERVKTSLQVLYDFSSTSGPIIKDRSGAGKPVNLVIGGANSVRRSEGSLEVHRKTLIQSGKEASRLIESIRRSGAVSIEAWIRPSNTTLDGPARIITLSENSSNRNFTLGQERDRYVLRLRTTKTSANGQPSLDSGNRTLSPVLTHVIYTRARGGLARIYINGKKNVEKNIGGNPSNWNGAYRLAPVSYTHLTLPTKA